MGFCMLYFCHSFEKVPLAGHSGPSCQWQRLRGAKKKKCALLERDVLLGLAEVLSLVELGWIQLISWFKWCTLVALCLPGTVERADWFACHMAL